MTRRRAARRVRARFDADAFESDLGRLRADSRARPVAEEARAAFTGEGVERTELMRCAAEGRDGTRLAGCLKVYLPLEESERPFRMVLIAGEREAGLELVYLAFGVGDQPQASPAPSADAIAHRRLHGRWPSL